MVGQAPLRMLTGEIPEQLTAKQRFRYVLPFRLHTSCLGSERHREQALLVLLLQSRSVQYRRPNWQKHLKVFDNCSVDHKEDQKYNHASYPSNSYMQFKMQ